MNIREGKAKLDTFDTLADALKGDRKLRRKAEAANKAGIRLLKELNDLGATVPLQRIREAIGVGAWDSIMLDAMYKKLMMGWEGVREEFQWSKITQRVPVRDFRTQNAIQVGSFTKLDKVESGGEYKEAEFSDDRATYTIAKYGNIFAASYEAMTNDDLNVFGRVLQKFAVAAQQTIEDFVLDQLIDDNPTIYDDDNLFSSDHANDLGDYDITHDSFESACLKMLAQTDIDGNHLSLKPKYLLCNPQQKYDALRVVNTPMRPSTANNDINVHAGEVEVISSSEITSGRWYLIADPMLADTIELGFLGGREAPEFFEEAPNSGHEFAHDERRWKTRIVFGGCVKDYRPFVRAGV